MQAAVFASDGRGELRLNLNIHRIAANRQVWIENRRLRLDCLKTILELGITLANFADASNCSERLRDAAYAAATKALTNVRKLLRNGMDRQALEPRLQKLESALKTGGVVEEPAGTALRAHGTPRVPFRDEMPAQLTPRELQVVRCIAEGQSTKQVAGELGIAFKTAACHRYRIMDKLNIHDTAGLVRYAIRNGLIAA